MTSLDSCFSPPQLDKHHLNVFPLIPPPAAFCKVGVGICYDMRFAELAQLYSRKGKWLIILPAWRQLLLIVCRRVDGVVLLSSGCQLLVYPGAFNMTTGPAHWELLQRGRSDWESQSLSRITFYFQAFNSSLKLNCYIIINLIISNNTTMKVCKMSNIAFLWPWNNCI